MSAGGGGQTSSSLKAYVKRWLPEPAYQGVRMVRLLMNGLPLWPPPDIYEQLYEHHCRVSSDADAVGVGPFDLIGQMELAVLHREGLQPTDTLVDFGCGTGRLAVHAIPALPHGRYIGIDISKEMLRRLDRRLREQIPDPPCRVSLVQQTSEVFRIEEASVDLLCAFSVFTHMEHEDTYRYLLAVRRIVRPGGRLIFSCLPMDSAPARDIFLQSASLDIQHRWGGVRCVTTTRDLMHEVSRLAGWTLARWYPGEEANITLPDQDAPVAFGQTIGVLE